MIKHSYIFIILIVIMIQSSSLEWYLDQNPIFLDKSTFTDTILNPEQIKIISFVTLQCALCPDLKDNIEDVIVSLNADGRNDVEMYFIDCGNQTKLCEEMSISDIPFTILFNNEGNAYEEYTVNHFGLQQTINRIINAIAEIDEQNRKEAERRIQTTKVISGNEESIKNEKKKEMEGKNLKSENMYAIERVESEEDLRKVEPNMKKKKIVQSLLNQRKKKKQWLNLNVGSVTGTLLLLIFIGGAVCYLKKVYPNYNSKKNNSVNMLYAKVSQSQEEKYPENKQHYDQKAKN